MHKILHSIWLADETYFLSMLNILEYLICSVLLSNITIFDNEMLKNKKNGVGDWMPLQPMFIVFFFTTNPWKISNMFSNSRILNVAAYIKYKWSEVSIISIFWKMLLKGNNMPVKYFRVVYVWVCKLDHHMFQILDCRLLRQAFIWTNVGLWWIGSVGTFVSEIKIKI